MDTMTIWLNLGLILICGQQSRLLRPGIEGG
jgi:hypothetical protein